MLAKELTQGERLYLQRFRKGLRQSAAAAEYGVGRNTYIGWERDDLSIIARVPWVKVGTLTEAESYVILRYRSGWRVSEIAKEIGVSRFWIHQMERGKAPIARLREFWASMEVPTPGY